MPAFWLLLFFLCYETRRGIVVLVVLISGRAAEAPNGDEVPSGTQKRHSRS